MEQNITGFTSSFVEAFIIDYMREIICNDQLDDLLCTRIDDQSLRLYDWTDNINYVPHQEVRRRITEGTKGKISAFEKESSVSMSSLGNMTRAGKVTERLSNKIAATQSNNAEDRDRDKTVKILEDIDDHLKFDEGQIQTLDEKYMNELTDKFKYNNFEMSEKILFINEDAKNLISTILEDTVYNIISEAVYGETNLTESTKIYFKKYNKK